MLWWGKQLNACSHMMESTLPPQERWRKSCCEESNIRHYAWLTCHCPQNQASGNRDIHSSRRWRNCCSPSVSLCEICDCFLWEDGCGDVYWRITQASCAFGALRIHVAVLQGPETRDQERFTRHVSSLYCCTALNVESCSEGTPESWTLHHTCTTTILKVQAWTMHKTYDNERDLAEVGWWWYRINQSCKTKAAVWLGSPTCSLYMPDYQIPKASSCLDDSTNHNQDQNLRNGGDVIQNDLKGFKVSIDEWYIIMKQHL